jgi:hypothetical protein
MPLNTKAVLEQIDSALAEWDMLRIKTFGGDYPEEVERNRVIHRLASTIGRLAPRGTIYKQQFDKSSPGMVANRSWIEKFAGMLQALRAEYAKNYLQTVQELVHADTFSGFLEMADHLRDAGYKDAAAVISGSVLEQHLRELSLKNGISVQHAGKFKKAETLNADLAGHAVYSKVDQKDVTAWLGLRNEAAHGNYSQYTSEQVRLMVDAIRHFVTRYPA